MFTIEKGIPIPEATRKGKAEKYQFSKLEVGDSIFVPAEANSAVSIVDRVKHAAYSAETRIEKKTGTKVRFIVRSDSVENVDGARVWRTADAE